jgi:arginine:agmatine antiporter
VLGYRKMSNGQYTFFVGAGLVGAIYCMIALIGSDGEQTRWSLVFVISTIVFFSASITRKRDIEEKHLHPGGRAPYWVRYLALGVTIIALVAMFWLSIGEQRKGDLRRRSPQTPEIQQPVGETGTQDVP